MVKNDPASQWFCIILDIQDTPSGTGLDGFTHIFERGTFSLDERRLHFANSLNEKGAADEIDPQQAYHDASTLSEQAP